MRLWLICLLLAPAAAVAQEDYTLIGAGVRTRPDFDGAKKQVVDIIPVLRYYGKPLFARTTQGILEGGARAELSPGLAAGLQLAYEGAGKTVDAGASIGAHLEWDTKLGPAPINLLARLRQNVNSDRGAQADLRATVGVYENGPVQAGVFTQATWANAKSMRAYYDVSGSGLLYVSLGALASYDFSRKWVLVTSAEARRLQGDAKDSAFVEKRSAYYLSAGIAYRF
jgi:outer membrane scaffolding protein for murein synthesis (MipA/OmpV family)